VRKAKLILGTAVLAFALIGAWQVVACEIANSELKEDLRDIAAQNSVRIGLAPPSTDEDLRSVVISKAKEHGIRLETKEITVQRAGTVEAPGINLAVDYRVPVNLPGFSFTLHFTPSAQGKPLTPVTQEM
jgi:hypothetical protein